MIKFIFLLNRYRALKREMTRECRGSEWLFKRHMALFREYLRFKVEYDFVKEENAILRKQLEDYSKVSVTKP